MSDICQTGTSVPTLTQETCNGEYNARSLLILPRQPFNYIGSGQVRE